MVGGGMKSGGETDRATGQGMGWQARVWVAAALIAFLLLWWLGDLLVPFFLGAALAYVFNPLVRRLERLGLPRVLAVAGIAIFLLVSLTLALLLILPAILSELRALLEAGPVLAEHLRELFEPWLPAPPVDLVQRINDMAETLLARGVAMVQRLLSGVMSAVNLVVMLLLLVPVIAFYLLLDWDRMIEGVDRLLPRDQAPLIRNIMAEIDHTLAAFLRGQALVCLILGAGYAVALMLVGLESALFAGFLAGFVSFIPYLGALIGGVVALGLGAAQFWGEWWQIGLVAVIFILGQFIESNILSPRLVGGSVGVHPVWVIFALSVMGALFGFIGLLVAVPAAAVVAVLVRHGAARYMRSELYLGQADDEAVDP